MAQVSRDLCSANSLRLACVAREVMEVRDVEALVKAIEHARSLGLQLTVLGDGTNVVLGESLPNLVLLVRNRGIWLDSDAEDSLLTAAAGENWHDLVRYSLAQGLFGIENLALIPGRVGAAPIQNIGAYGVELSEVFESLEARHRETGAVKLFTRDECEFGYRRSLFKIGADNPWIIWRITLRLSRTARVRAEYKDLALELQRLGVSKPTPIQVAEAVVRVRRRKLPDPRFVANVGSFFKNPLASEATVARLRELIPDLVAWPLHEEKRFKLSAAQLIDRAGLKGLRMGGARVWPRQPLVLVNETASRRRSLLLLAEHVQTEVAQRWGVELEFEPDFYP